MPPKNIKTVYDIAKFARHMVVATLAVGVIYVGTQVYMNYISATPYPVFEYLKNEDEINRLAECPKFIKIESVTGAIMLKDDCTDVFWNRFDLPLYTNATPSVLEGYTWKEANDYCEGLATSSDRTQPIFRLPTADELLSVVDFPCTTPGKCSPFSDKAAKFANIDNDPSTDEGFLLPGDSDANRRLYTNEFETGKIFADGAYWASDQIDIDGNVVNDTETTEAASSVNLKYGTVNNPVFGKSVRLNVRCVYNKLNPADYKINSATIDRTLYDINEMQWSIPIKATTGCSAGSYKLSMADRKNYRPKNGDMNDCPIGLDDDLTGDFQLCTSISEPTQQCQFFGCDSGKKLLKKPLVAGQAPIECGI